MLVLHNLETCEPLIPCQLRMSTGLVASSREKEGSAESQRDGRCSRPRGAHLGSGNWDGLMVRGEGQDVNSKKHEGEHKF